MSFEFETDQDGIVGGTQGRSGQEVRATAKGFAIVCAISVVALVILAMVAGKF